MPDTCETVRIMPSHPSQGEFVEINAEDYDPAVHKLVDGETVPELKGDADQNGYLSKPEIIADLDRLGIDYDKRWSRDKLDARLREGKAAREAAVNATVEE